MVDLLIPAYSRDRGVRAGALVACQGVPVSINRASTSKALKPKTRIVLRRFGVRVEYAQVSGLGHDSLAFMGSGLYEAAEYHRACLRAFWCLKGLRAL